MGGAISGCGLGLCYLSDPTGQGRKGPMVYKGSTTPYQVLVPNSGVLIVVAECVYEMDAEILLKTYKADHG